MLNNTVHLAEKKNGRGKRRCHVEVRVNSGEKGHIPLNSFT